MASFRRLIPYQPLLETLGLRADSLQIDWNQVAEEQGITNGHAARMRYSRFKPQMEATYPTQRKAAATGKESSSKESPDKGGDGKKGGVSGGAKSPVKRRAKKLSKRRASSVAEHSVEAGGVSVQDEVGAGNVRVKEENGNVHIKEEDKGDHEAGNVKLEAMEQDGEITTESGETSTDVASGAEGYGEMDIKMEIA